MIDWKKSIKEALNFDRTAIIGLILLIISFTLGAILRKSVNITNEAIRRLATCDTYISWLCIPTAYFSIPVGEFGWLVINVTSLLVSVILFILGVLLLKK
jgi:hypothetical protein